MLLMVYGTLMKEFENHYVIEKSRFIGNAFTRGVLYHLPEGYPAVIDGTGTIKGEVYDIDEEILREIDMLEDYFGEGDERNLYNREKRYAQLESCESVMVYIYKYVKLEEVKQVGIHIPDGDWGKFIKCDL
ncbi:MAG: gamma-glutamylcyclotransferase [Clostridia bacterium]|nr:gamma-glutamylcyclotransferase [Clostridia bacterium]